MQDMLLGLNIDIVGMDHAVPLPIDIEETGNNPWKMHVSKRSVTSITCTLLSFLVIPVYISKGWVPRNSRVSTYAG